MARTKETRKKLLHKSVAHRAHHMGQIIQRIKQKIGNRSRSRNSGTTSGSRTSAYTSSSSDASEQTESQSGLDTEGDMLVDRQQAISIIAKISSENPELEDLSESDRKVLAQAACLTNKEDILENSFDFGADYREYDRKGYSPLHLSAAWGWCKSVKFLIDNVDIDVFKTTFLGEKPSELARRYGQTVCLDMLLKAEAKNALLSYIKETKDMIADQDRVQGKLTKDEIKIISNACNGKHEWVTDSYQKVATAEISKAKDDLCNAISTIIAKVNNQK
ncbi:PREDICTED: ankyrin repeat domain-containing protein 45-like [Priapulus caudatus]|uniref:Ankyrin repeat domain-containing protein 45-like n=1 Tax=Priapulus caudatus TaxID=37621 RepID=A0ABM1F9R9_PRICU|nr:PREDICTED: ankyrin repeat domain-containing protein 45-like [Priapulus caudatus]